MTERLKHFMARNINTTRGKICRFAYLLKAHFFYCTAKRPKNAICYQFYRSYRTANSDHDLNLLNVLSMKQMTSVSILETVVCPRFTDSHISKTPLSLNNLKGYLLNVRLRSFAVINSSAFHYL